MSGSSTEQDGSAASSTATATPDAAPTGLAAHLATVMSAPPSSEPASSSQEETAPEPSPTPKPPEAGSLETAAGADEPTPEADAEAPRAEAKAETEPEVPFHTHPRWQAKQAEIRTLRAELEEVRAAAQQIEPLKQQAEGFQRIASFCNEAGISGEELDTLLSIGRLMKADPAAAAKALEPYYRNVRQAAGEELAPDLAQEVEDGFITEARAKELMRYRAQASAFKAIEDRSAKTAAARAAKAETDRVTGIATQVSAMERELLRSDPDYRTIQKRVTEQIELWVRRQGHIPQNDIVLAKFQEIVAAERRANATRKPRTEAVPKPVFGGGSGATTTTRATPPRTLAEHLARAMG